MSRILTDQPEQDRDVAFGAESLRIGERLYRNTAAKFWSHLVDEILADFPACDRTVLQAPTDRLLDDEMLDPVKALQRQLERNASVDTRAGLAETLAELAILGEPGPVTISLHAGDTQIATRQLPLDCLNADILPVLAVWLLHWAEVPAFLWNNERVAAQLVAQDAGRHYTYELDAAVGRRELSEGLCMLSVELRFQRS